MSVFIHYLYIYLFFSSDFFLSFLKEKLSVWLESERAGFANSRAAATFLSQVKFNQILSELTNILRKNLPSLKGKSVP